MDVLSGTGVGGLPVVIIGGVGLLLLLLLLVRFGRAIGRFALVAGALGIGAVLSLAALAQGGANFEQSRATVEMAKTVQTAQSGQMLLVGMASCTFGAMALAMLALVGVVLFLWWKSQRVATIQQQRPQMAVQHAQPMIQQPGQFAEWPGLDNFDSIDWIVEGGEQCTSEQYIW